MLHGSLILGNQIDLFLIHSYLKIIFKGIPKNNLVFPFVLKLIYVYVYMTAQFSGLVEAHQYKLAELC